jgi:DNA-binding CsgD family transcriptional regulator
MSHWADRRGRWLIAAAVGMYAAMLGGELSQEGDDLALGDIFFEALQLALLVGCTVALALVGLRVRAQEEESLVLRQDLQAIGARGERWRQEMAVHLRELGRAIQAQFAAWGLTAAEQEVGLLLLKGFSHKEIARFRDTAESTIRQQATSIYQKANVGGRAALSAYFLEELLLPGQPAPPDAVAEATPPQRATMPSSKS